MSTCAYCQQRATVNIPANPGNVCATHAFEFWTGLLAHVKARAEEFESQRPYASAPSSGLPTSRRRSGSRPQPAPIGDAPAPSL